MIFGTSSGAGKTLMSAAICRVLLRRGEVPLPFKGQNMSNNAWVDEDGGEMAFSQAMQAWAAGLTPRCLMNPVLLKPQGDSTSEVIHLGKSVGISRAEKYYEDWFDSGWTSIVKSINGLTKSNEFGRLIIEGAGSPVEVNLQKRDLTNLRIAKYVNANCLLIADIERGGVFAQLIGTIALLKSHERKMIKGILINRFRGRRELFDEGRSWIEKKTGIPVVGVMPWLNDLFPPEDSLDLLERRINKKNIQIDIVVIKLSSISNFSDLDPLEAENTVQVRWVEPYQPIGWPDAVIIPGSKQTINDLQTLFDSGMSDQIRNYAEKGGHVVGICGGMQILGRSLSDPINLEGMVDTNSSTVSGLDLLPIHTEFIREKKLFREEVEINWPKNSKVVGFELHRGVSYLLEKENSKASNLNDGKQIGWKVMQEDNRCKIFGTYLHGIFDNGLWRRLWINQLRKRKGLDDLPVNIPNHSIKVNALLDSLADAFEDYVDISPLIGP